MEEKNGKGLPREDEGLRGRPREAEEVLRAIRGGEVDALAITGSGGEKIYTLEGADRVYRILMDSMNEGALALSQEGTVLYGNLCVERMLCAVPTKLVGTSIAGFIPLEERKAFESLIDRAGKEGSARGEIRLLDPNGAAFTASASINAVDFDGKQGYCVIVSDLTERKAVEEQLRRNHEELEARVRERTAELYEANQKLQAEILERKATEEELRKSRHDLNRAQAVARIGSWRLDMRRNELLWSDETYRIFGIHKGTPLTYDSFLAAVHPEDREYVDRQWTNALRGLPYDIEHRILAGVSVKWVRERAELEFDEDGSLTGGFGTVQDITELKIAGEVLRENEARLRQIIDLVPHMIFVKDRDGRYLLVNRAVAEGYNTSVGDLTGRLHGEFHPDEEELRRMLRDDREVMEKGETRFIEEEAYTDASGRVRLLQTTKVPFFSSGNKARAVLGVAVDITEQRRAEAEREKLRAQFNQAQKMESVGRLAGGVAHDFNNMLSVILGHTELAGEQMGPDHPLLAHLVEIDRAARRSADLTRQLLAFARRQTIAPRVLDLNETVEGMLKMLRRLIGENIDLAWIPGENLWPVKVDSSQVDHILANLCVNARDAIEGVGRITIETGTTTFDEAYCAAHAGFTPGEFVLLAVSDDGCGMDRETLAKVFEPFFTTKEVGKGTGLGLATVYGIVKQNNGFINVYSEPGKGTTFKVYFPRREAVAGQIQQAGPEPPAKRGSETILLVEDEPTILHLTRKMLEGLGYAALTAGTPGEAMRIAEEHAGEIHLLITDVVMPGMNGRDLARHLSARYPNLGHLFMSGYTANVIAHNGVLDEDVNFIQKPFSKQDLAAKVREALACRKCLGDEP